MLYKSNHGLALSIALSIFVSPWTIIAGENSCENFEQRERQENTIFTSPLKSGLFGFALMGLISTVGIAWYKYSIRDTVDARIGNFIKDLKNERKRIQWYYEAETEVTSYAPCIHKVVEVPTIQTATVQNIFAQYFSKIDSERVYSILHRITEECNRVPVDYYNGNPSWEGIRANLRDVLITTQSVKPTKAL
jgi:hypothetical protein